MFQTLVGIGGPVFSWYRLQRQRAAEDEASRRALLLKRTLLILAGVFCSLVVVAAVAKTLVALRIITLDSVFSVAGTPPVADEHGHINILLLGHGDAGHAGQNLMDSIMIASLDPKNTKSIVLLSFPRDLYFLRTDNMGAGRINTLYRDYRSYLEFDEGMESEAASPAALRELAAELGRSFGLTIHHVVKADFRGFVETVDALGGVDVTVPTDILDTEYPDENFGYQTFRISAGLQHLDGETALKYARSRHTTSDFDRSARQQQILKAMAEKAEAEGLQRDPVKIAALLNTLSENIETTMTLSEIIGLAQVAREIDRSRLITMQLSDRSGLYGGFVEPGGFLYTPPREQFEGASVLLPVSLPEYPVTWKQVQTLVRFLQTNRETYVSQPTFAILNAGAPSGGARVLATELIRYGFDIPVIENAEGDEREASIIYYRDAADAELAAVFGRLLQMETAPLPADLPPAQIGRLTIMLGSAYQYIPLQDLLPAAS